jgi:hypothetical protein
MKVTATISAKDMAYFLKRMKEYEKEMEKDIGTAMKELGKACAKEIAHNIQPLGLSKKVGDKMKANIKKQVHTAISDANRTPGSGSAASEHQSRRNSRGRVPNANELTKGNKDIYARSPIELSDRFALATKKAENAGMAKGAWIGAGEAIDGKKMSGIPKWLRMHVRHGDAIVDTGKKGTEIILHNKISYISKVQMRSTIGQILRVAYRKQLKRMNITINKKNNKI